MLSSKSYNHTPAPDDPTAHSASREFTEQLEALKAKIAEGEDLCAEFVIEMQKEAKRLSKKMGE